VIDLIMELPMLWVSVAPVMVVVAMVAYENFKLRRMHMRMKRTVHDTDKTGCVDMTPVRPLALWARPKIPYFRDKGCQDDDGPYPCCMHQQIAA
jgi:hypothetical protein